MLSRILEFNFLNFYLGRHRIRNELFLESMSFGGIYKFREEEEKDYNLLACLKFIMIVKHTAERII